MRNNSRKSQTPGKVRYRTPSRVLAKSAFTKSREAAHKMKAMTAARVVL